MQEMNDAPCLRAGIFWIEGNRRYSWVLNTRGSWNNWNLEIWNFFWKLISEGVLFNKGWEIFITLTYFALIKKASVFYVIKIKDQFKLQ